MKKTIFSLIISFMMLLTASMCFVDKNNCDNVYALTSGNLVALGDSITTGCKLDNQDTNKQSVDLYVNKIASNYNYSVINDAVNGATISDLITEIEKADISNHITNANIVLITIGGNDILIPILQDINDNEVMYAINHSISLQAETKATLETNIGAFETQLTDLFSALKTKNANATFVLQTVYNPVPNIEGNAYSIPYSNISEEINPYITRINTIISSNSAGLGYSVADVYTAFNSSATELTNFSNFDIHPNVSGHEVIYQTVKPLSVFTPSGEVDPPITPVVTKNIPLQIYTDGVWINEPDAVQGTPGGTVSGASANSQFIPVQIGTNPILTFTANPGYKLFDVIIDTVDMGVIESYQIESTIPTIIVVSFVSLPKTQNVIYKNFTNNEWVNNPDAEAGVSGGTIVQNTEDLSTIEISKGKSTTLNFRANDGYTISKVVVDNNNLGQINYLTINGVNIPNTIEVHYLENFNVLFNVGEHGTVTVESSVITNNLSEENKTKICLFSKSLNCVVAPDFGYKIKAIKIDDVSTEIENNLLVVSNVIADKNISVEFEQITSFEFTDQENNVTLKANISSAPYGSSLVVSTTSASAELCSKIKNTINEYAHNMIVYSMLLQKDNLVITPTGSVQITISVPLNFNLDKTKLFYYSESGNATEIDYTLKDRELTFSTNHFSNYVLIEMGEKDYSFLAWLIPLIIVAVLGIAGMIVLIVLKNKKKRMKKMANR